MNVKIKVLVLKRNSYVSPLEISRSLLERVIFPLQCLKDFVDVECCRAEDVRVGGLSRYGVLFLCRHTSVDAYLLAKKAKDLGLKVLYDIDDWIFDFPENNIAGLGESARKSALDMMRLADRVIASNFFLSKLLLEKFQIDAVVVPSGFYVPSLSDDGGGDFYSKKVLFVNGDNLKIKTFQSDFFKFLKTSFRDEERSLHVYADTYDLFPSNLRYEKKGRRKREVFLSELVDERFHFAITPLSASEELESVDFIRCKSPVKYLLYGSIGLPCIYSDSWIYRDVVKDMDTGILVANTIESWMGAFERLISDDNLRSRISKNSYEDVRLNYSLDISARKILKVIEEVIDE